MKGLIISNGNIKNYDKLISMLRTSDYVICADGGIRHLRCVDKKPNIVIGDLDSVNQEDIDYIESKNINIKKFPSIKDDTDTEISVTFLIDMGCTEIWFLGATGDRIDHTFANVFLLDSLLKKNIKGVIVDDKNEIYLVDDFLELKNEENSYVSIIPISQDGTKLSISGFFYNLDNGFIPFGSTKGISNEIVKEKGSIQIHKGKAIIIKAID